MIYCFNSYEVANYYGGRRSFEINSLIDIFNTQLINFFLRLKISLLLYVRVSSCKKLIARRPLFLVYTFTLENNYELDAK